MNSGRIKRVNGARNGQALLRKEEQTIVTPQLRPFFGYYGGKWRDAVRHYPQPEYETIVEPFAGSAGFSLRYFDRKVVLCELDPVLAAVWRYLIHVKRKGI